MNLEPLSDIVIVRRDKGDEMSKGGIILPDAAKQKPGRGVVLAVGPGKEVVSNAYPGSPLWVQTMNVKPGDHIFFSTYSAWELEFDGDKVLALHQEDIIAIIKE